jgi:hypothetical protein
VVCGPLPGSLSRATFAVGFRPRVPRGRLLLCTPQQVLCGGRDAVCDGHGIGEASRSGHEGVRRLHVHADGDFERRGKFEGRLREPRPGWL